MNVSHGNVFNIQRYCLHDGPGIRTTVFFKGCPLKCKWCENPESKKAEPQLSYHASRCIGCEGCRSVCDRGSLDDIRSGRIDWASCNGCGRCTEVCNSGALEMIGKEMTVEEIMAEIRKDDAFYLRSGGGVTISGGEPTYQFDFLLVLLQALKAEHYHVVLETSGLISTERLESIAALVDIFYLDVKGIESARHTMNTGVGNELILSNAKYLKQQGCSMVYRIPLIPGFNNGPEDIELLKKFLDNMEATEAHLLPYHDFGESKLKQIDVRQNPLGLKRLAAREIERIRKHLESPDRTITIGGS